MCFDPPCAVSVPRGRFPNSEKLLFGPSPFLLLRLLHQLLAQSDLGREEEEPPLPGSAAGAGVRVRVISVHILFCHFIFVFYLRYGVKRSLASSAVTGS